MDDGDELIGTLNETSTGIYEMKELLYGKYLVRETKAPEGFELDKGVYSVFIEKDETTYEVENKAGVGFINTAMKGNLKIVKTSSDDKVEGFTFRVTGVNGYDRSFTTDKNGEIIIEGLRIGDYTVSEVQDLELVRNSVSYMVMARLGLNADKVYSPDDFAGISSFNSQEVLNAVGIATSDIAEMALLPVSRTISTLSKPDHLAEPGC